MQAKVELVFQFEYVIYKHFIYFSEVTYAAVTSDLF